MGRLGAQQRAGSRAAGRLAGGGGRAVTKARSLHSSPGEAHRAGWGHRGRSRLAAHPGHPLAGPEGCRDQLSALFLGHGLDGRLVLEDPTTTAPSGRHRARGSSVPARWVSEPLGVRARRSETPVRPRPGRSDRERARKGSPGRGQRRSQARGRGPAAGLRRSTRGRGRGTPRAWLLRPRTPPDRA